MKARLLIWFFTLFLLTSAVAAYTDADITAYTIGYWNFDYNLTYDNASAAGWGSLTNELITPTSMDVGTGIVGSSADMDAGTDAMQAFGTVFNNIGRSQDFSALCWVKPVSGAQHMFGQFGATDDTKWRTYTNYASGEIYFCNGYVGTAEVLGGWTLWTLTWNEATNYVRWYKNATLDESDNGRTCGSNAQDLFEWANTMPAGAESGTLAFDGCMYINKTLTPKEVEYIYNETKTRNLLASSPAADVISGNFSIKANGLNGTNLTTFSAVMTQNGVSYQWNTTNGQINTTYAQNSTLPFYNITIISDQYFGFYNKTYTNYNTSTNLTAQLFPATRIAANNFYDGAEITFNISIAGSTGTSISSYYWRQLGTYDFNISAFSHFPIEVTGVNLEAYNGTNYTAKLIKAIVRINPLTKSNTLLTLPFNLSTANYYNNSNLLYLTNGSISITFQKAGYHNQTQAFSITSLENDTINMTGIYESVLNITAANKAGTNLTTFSVNITASGYSEVVSTTDGGAEIGVMNRKYNVTIDAVPYEIKTEEVNVPGDYTYNFSLFQMNNINFTFKNEATGAILSGINVSLNIFGSINYTNLTTEAGSYYIELLYPDEYTIRYSAEGYAQRFYYFTLTNRTSNNITLYLSATTSNVTAYVYSEINDLVEGVTIKTLKYDLSTNSYILVEMSKTNFEGQSILHLTKNSEFYKFVLEYEGETKLTTTPTYIYGDTLNFQIVLNPVVAENYFKSTRNIDFTLTFNNVTNNFVYTFNDIGNEISKGCLYVYTLTAKTKSVYGSSCSDGVTGTILVNVAATNGTSYEAKAYVYYNSEYEFVGSLFKSFLTEYKTGNLGLLLVIVLTIVFVFVGIWNPTIAVIIAPLPMIFGSILHLINLDPLFAIPIEVLAVIIAIVISRRA